jgi:hypothetical protein
MTKRIVDIHSLDSIIKTAGMSELYETLDTVHMNSLRDYVYDHLTYKAGDKPRTKAGMIREVVDIVERTKADQNVHRRNQSHRAIDETTRRYADDALSECAKMQRVLSRKCGGIRKYTKQCRTAKASLNAPDWVRMETNIKRIQTCDDTCPDSVVDAAGDIGNYLASCPGLTCYEVQRITGKMPGGPCRRFKKN